MSEGSTDGIGDNRWVCPLLPGATEGWGPRLVRWSPDQKAGPSQVSQPPDLTPRGGTRSGKGYRLRSDRWRAVAVTTRDGLKRGAVLISYCRIGMLLESVQLIFPIKLLLYAFKFVLRPSRNNDKVKYYIFNIENCDLHVSHHK